MLGLCKLPYNNSKRNTTGMGHNCLHDRFFPTGLGFGLGLAVGGLGLGLGLGLAFFEEDLDSDLDLLT